MKEGLQIDEQVQVDSEILGKFKGGAARDGVGRHFVLIV